MNSIKDYLENVKGKMTRKEELLGSMYSKYNQLMSMSDEDIRIFNCNERVLSDDPVYNSDKASDKLKEVIRTRKLKGMTEEEFENSYKQVLYGIGGEWLEILADRQEKGVELEIKDEPVEKKEKELLPTTLEYKLDVIPTYIPMGTLIKSRHSEKYLLGICKENELTLGQLNDLVDLKTEYSSNLNTLLSLINDDFSIEEIGNLLETRDQIMSEIEDAPALRQLAGFYKRFDSVPLWPDSLKELIKEIHKNIGGKYVHFSLKLFMERADELNCANLETVLDFIEGSDGYTREIKSIDRFSGEQLTRFKEGILGENMDDESFP